MCQIVFLSLENDLQLPCFPKRKTLLQLHGEKWLLRDCQVSLWSMQNQEIFYYGSCRIGRGKALLFQMVVLLFSPKRTTTVNKSKVGGLEICTSDSAHSWKMSNFAIFLALSESHEAHPLVLFWPFLYKLLCSLPFFQESNKGPRFTKYICCRIPSEIFTQF